MLNFLIIWQCYLLLVIFFIAIVSFSHTNLPGLANRYMSFCCIHEICFISISISNLVLIIFWYHGFDSADIFLFVLFVSWFHAKDIFLYVRVLNVNITLTLLKSKWLPIVKSMNWHLVIFFRFIWNCKELGWLYLLRIRFNLMIFWQCDVEHVCPSKSKLNPSRLFLFFCNCAVLFFVDFIKNDRLSLCLFFLLWTFFGFHKFWVC